MSPNSLVASPVPLRDALYALATAQSGPDAALLDDMVRRFPEHAEALTAYAIELALNALSEAASDEDIAPLNDADRVSPAVSRALSRFYNRRHAIAQGAADQDKIEFKSAEALNPFVHMDRKAFRAFADRIGANNVFVQKLRDRQIDADTLTPGFKQWMSDELPAPLEVVVAHFAAGRGASAGVSQFFKADGKPDPTKRQTFAEAVASSGLSEEQQQRLLAR
jgi:hypothetical protein